MELILLVIFGVVFKIIKTLAEQQTNAQKPKIEPRIEKYPVEDKTRDKSSRRRITPSETPMTPQYTDKLEAINYEDLEVQVQYLDDEEEVETKDGIFASREDIVKGIIMSEILESPRFKKPHRIR